jgi:hypothetical protein
VKTRDLRQQCERFTARVIAEGANSDELTGLMIGNYNNPTNVPVDQNERGS